MALSLELDRIERNLVDRLQSDFPLVATPFAEMGRKLGISEPETIARLAMLKERGIIRQIGPVLDAGRLGYRTTLVAMKISAGHLEEAARVIAAHPMVSHGYERDHDLNVWITLGVPPAASPESEMAEIARDCQAETFFSLPAVRVFKLNAYFGLGENGSGSLSSPAPETLSRPTRLFQADRRVINVLQQDLPLLPAPFDGLAAKAGLETAAFLERCHSLREKGVLRRFGAAINHRRAGFTANAMTCWSVLPGMVAVMAQRLAALPQVSHCYERATNPAWRYNLFAMMHGHGRDICRDIAERVTGESGLEDFIQLYSTREFKKQRVIYTV